MSAQTLHPTPPDTPFRQPLRTLRELPSPPGGLPWLGNLLQLKPLQAHRQFERWAQALGTPYCVWLARMAVVVFDDAELFQQVMRDRPQGYRRGGRIRPVSAEMGFDGLFSAEGKDWAPQRRLVMKALNPSHLKGYLPTLSDITERLRHRWLAAAEQGLVLDMGSELMRYTVDVTSALAFGEDPRTLEHDGNQIQQHLATIFPMFMKRVMSPFSSWHWIKLPADRRLDRSLAAVHAHVDALVQRAQARRKAQPDQAPVHLLDALIDASLDPDHPIAPEQVRANVLTLLLAGEDTTAHSLAWAMFYLAQDPHLQDTLHAQSLAQPGCPGVEGLRQLDMFEAVVTEALRLRPVVPFHSFEPLQDTVLGGVHLPKDTKIFFLSRPAMLDPAHFHEPQRFDPQRWLRSHDEHTGPHEARAFLQFGAGPRVCPGRHLAGVEMRLVLSMLMRDFRLELTVPPTQIAEIQAFTMLPEHLPIRLHRRQTASARATCPHHEPAA